MAFPTEHGIEPPNNLDIDDKPNLRKWLINLWARFPQTRVYTVTFNPASIAANSTSEQTVTVSGLETTDIVIVSKPSHTSGVGIVNARVSATDTLAITFMNVTAGAVDPVSEIYTLIAIRQ